MSKFETYFGQQMRGNLNEDFKKDLASLLKLTPNARNELAKAVVRGLLTLTDKEERALRDELATKFKDEPVALTGPFQFLGYFAKMFLADPDDDPRAKDEPAKIASDLGKMADIYPKDVSNSQEIFAEVLEALKKVALPAKEAVLQRTYETGVLPSFKGIGTTVELRGIQDIEFQFGDVVEQYTPHFVGLVGVASIRIRVDEGNPDIFCFQASDRQLTNLIDALRATQKELRSLETKVKANGNRTS